MYGLWLQQAQGSRWQQRQMAAHRFRRAGNAQYCILHWGKQMLGDTKLWLNWLPQSLWCLFSGANTSKKRTARFLQWCSALKRLERLPAPWWKIAWAFGSVYHHELHFNLIPFINSGALCLQTAELLLHRFLNTFEKETKQSYLLGKIRKQRGKLSCCLLLWKLSGSAPEWHYACSKWQQSGKVMGNWMGRGTILGKNLQYPWIGAWGS